MISAQKRRKSSIGYSDCREALPKRNRADLLAKTTRSAPNFPLKKASELAWTDAYASLDQ